MTWWRSLSVLLCILAALVSPRTASGASTAQAETRVNGFSLVATALVGGSTARTLEKNPGNAVAYGENGSVYALAAEGMEGAGGALTTLFHGTDLASALSIVSKGISRAAARALGGGDVFWATSEQQIAKIFAAANPAGGQAAVVGMRIPTATLQDLIRGGAVAIDQTGAYMVQIGLRSMLLY